MNLFLYIVSLLFLSIVSSLRHNIKSFCFNKYGPIPTNAIPYDNHPNRLVFS